jgi:hypothetical protein
MSLAACFATAVIYDRKMFMALARDLEPANAFQTLAMSGLTHISS